MVGLAQVIGIPYSRKPVGTGSAMDSEQLKELLKRAHGELSEPDAEVDPELRALLGDLDRDIQTLLQKEEKEPAPDLGTEGGEEGGSLSNRAEAAAARFAARHPRAEGVLLEIAEVLGRMGI